MKRVCVFCGSSDGARGEYTSVARALAAELARRRLGLVYGGGGTGMMGVLADAMLAAGGDVIGVIPGPLASRELAHRGLTELRVVRSMHERKALMSELADGFVTLPGGLGTLEETLEMLTWAQLGLHAKPVGVLDVAGYFDGLRTMLRHGVEEGFVRSDYAALLLFEEQPARLLDRFEAWRPHGMSRVWLDPTQT